MIFSLLYFTCDFSLGWRWLNLICFSLRFLYSSFTSPELMSYLVIVEGMSELKAHWQAGRSQLQSLTLPGTSEVLEGLELTDHIRHAAADQTPVSPLWLPASLSYSLVGCQLSQRAAVSFRAHVELRAPVSFASFWPCQRLQCDWHWHCLVSARRELSDAWASQVDFVLRAFGSIIYCGSEGRVSY